MDIVDDGVEGVREEEAVKVQIKIKREPDLLTDMKPVVVMSVMTLFTGTPKKRCGYVTPLYPKKQYRAHTTSKKQKNTKEENVLVGKARYFDAEWYFSYQE